MFLDFFHYSLHHLQVIAFDGKGNVIDRTVAMEGLNNHIRTDAMFSHRRENFARYARFHTRKLP